MPARGRLPFLNHLSGRLFLKGQTNARTAEQTGDEQTRPGAPSGFDRLTNWVHDDHIRIVVDGIPNLTLDLNMSMGDVAAPLRGRSPASMIIAMSALRALPSVMSAEPGI